MKKFCVNEINFFFFFLRKISKKFFFFTSSFLAVEIRIQTLAAHLGDLLDLAVCHVLEQPSQIRPRVHRLQLFFIQVQHLVDPSFVLELRIKNGIVA